jgi:hypothetical protein
VSGGPGTTELRTDELKHFATLDRWNEQSEEPDSAAVSAWPNDAMGDEARYREHPEPLSTTSASKQL